MDKPVAYLDGQWVDWQSMSLPVTDAGFVLGVTVAEQLRTFDGRLFRLESHLNRLHRSLEIVGVESPLTDPQIADVAEELVARNLRLIDPADDLGLTLFVTPGDYSTYAPRGSRPRIGLHTYPVAFGLWADKYALGEQLCISHIRQVPSDCWPAELKCRSRMHYYLADREARQRIPGSRAVLLDLDGHVIEASTANLVIFREGAGLVSPPAQDILPGISVAVMQELAAELKIPFEHRKITVPEFLAADEILLTSTSPCLLPVTMCDGQPIGNGQPGPAFQQLLTAWCRLVGVDIRAQAERFATRCSPNAART